MFRTEAIINQQTKWLGEIVIVRPISFGFLAGTGAICACILLCFFAFATYTKHSTVVGQVLPDTGLIKIYASQFGIIRNKFVVEGQIVKQGDILYSFSSERQSSTQGNTQAAISRQVGNREESLREELNKTRQLQKDERNAMFKKIEALRAELQKIDTQFSAQSARVKLANDALDRYQNLVAKNYVSAETLQQKQADLLDQNLHLNSLERERIGVGRDLSAQESDLNSLPLRHHNQLAVIKRNIAITGQELTESEARRDLIITAPMDGIATTVMADIGQVVDASKPLVSIMPKNAVLQAHLFAPSKAIGFVKPGDSVLLRYQAYPYQKFGHAKGTVTSVSRTVLPNSEIASIINSNLLSSSEPLYRVTVALAAQTVSAYGKLQPLQAGMLLEADTLQETRRLYEWVLEPLYSLTGKL